LRAELAQRASQAKDPAQRQNVRWNVISWKADPSLANVRDPAWLASMPAPDRKAWEALWADVDALLAATPLRTAQPAAKP
jgi:hypothetical protein